MIGSQIGQNPLRLRKWTVLKLKNDFQNLAEWIDKIFQSEGNDGVIRMIGGANYTGNSSNDAKKILDNSQGKSSTISQRAGHARGHASNPAIPKNDWEGSIENYSQEFVGCQKTAFLSSADQDRVTDLALRTDRAQRAMERLNQGSGQEVITISAEDLKKLNPNLDIPKMNIWRDGNPHGDEHDMQMVRLILRHHENKSDHHDADVMVQTCIPISRKPRQYW